MNGTINPNYLPATYQILWGTSADYGNTLVPEQNSLDGGDNVSISNSLSGLAPGTTYHYRIEAANELGTTQSADNTFKTLGDMPSITTPALSELTTSSVVITTQVNPNYLASAVVAEYGLSISYGETLPTGQDSLKGHTATEVVMHIEGLVSGTEYHIRIKATNELGDSYSDDITFNTYSAMDYDGNYYYSVKVNDQEWLKENLMNTHFANGDAIPEITDGTEWSNTIDPAYCQYNNDPAVSAVYGYLYNFFVAVDSRNVCPDGWHVPSLDDWHALITYLGGDTLGDIKIREAGTTHWFTDTGATNETGMTVLPAGNRESNGSFYNRGASTHLWSSFEGTVDYSTGAWNIGLDNGVSRIFWTPYSNKYGASIRCLKDIVAK